MDRVSQRITLYFAVITIGVGAIYLMLPWPPTWMHLVVASIFLLPGRLQGLAWREFFRGRYLMNQQDYQAAEIHFQNFLNHLNRNPKLQLAAYLSWNFYTWDAQAMALNNLGACHLIQGKLKSAETKLLQAVGLDASNPLPFFNLAVLAQTRGLEDEAEDLRAKAYHLGFRASTRENLILKAGNILASFEGSL